MKENNKKKELVRKFLTTPYTLFAFNLKEFESKNNIELTWENKDQKTKTNIKFLTKKMPYFKIEITNKKKSLKNSNFNDGRWKKDEQNLFLKGIALYGNNWKKVKSLIRTRTTVQVRSHAQKFFNKAKLFKDNNLGIDFTLNSIHNYNDMIKQIKNIDPNYNIVNIFKNLSDKADNKRNYKGPKNNYNNNNDKNSLCRIEEQKVIQDNEKNYLDNNQIVINENNNNINYNIPYNSTNLLPNIFNMTNNFINDNNYNKSLNILNNVFDLDVNSNLLLNYNNFFIFNLCNDFISMNRISISIINSLNQINNIFFSLRIQNNISNLDNRSPGNKLCQTNNNNIIINSVEK